MLAYDEMPSAKIPTTQLTGFFREKTAREFPKKASSDRSSFSESSTRLSSKTSIRSIRTRHNEIPNLRMRVDIKRATRNAPRR